MPAPLSLDLRQRIVDSYEPFKNSVRKVAANFKVGSATVMRLVNKAKNSENIEPKDYIRGPKKKIPESTHQDIIKIVEEKNDITLEELCDKYEEKHNIRVSITNMHNTLARLKITRKKKL